MKAEQQGLTQEAVLKSRQEHGENVLTPPQRQSMWCLYLEKFDDPMVRILLVAAIISLMLSFVSNDFLESIGIIVAIFLATTVGFYFERDAARKFDVLTQMGEEQPVKVLRDGRVQEIARREVVVGDIVLLDTGDEVPADGKLIESSDLQVDESSLTGEPMTTKCADHSCRANDQQAIQESVVSAKGQRSSANIQPEEAYPRDMLLRSSMVMGGVGRYVVTAVGDMTEIGHVAREATALTAVKTPLNIQLDHLAKLISKVGSTVAIAAFGVFLTHDILTNALWSTTNYVGMAETVLKYFMMAVTLIVMAVPEGLPMAVTLALALNMRRMLKSNNLVRKLQASETMGAVTVICTDKTGTLTENRMTVADVKVLGDGCWEMDDSITQHPSPITQHLYKAIALNTTATHEVGNPTEQALLRWLQKEGVDYEQLRLSCHIDSREPFSTERKYMTTTIGTTNYIKGAPEIVIRGCNLDDEERQQVEALLHEWQSHAMRTLAIAENSRLLAIVAISDPLRKEVPDAITQCQKAGIDVKIVTGDTTATALEIARQAGVCSKLTTDKSQPTITGAEFASMSDQEALSIVHNLKVMSRARPSDKQRLVALLQQQGQVVAVTGDGTNDAPALNRAHVGLSLGSGTSVAKQASDITLIDDSFRSIVHAVMWGRSLYKNIQRFIFFQLTVNVTALLLVLCGAFVGTELPLTITQILWVNLIMDTFAAMALASLPPSREVMAERPRAQDSFIISKSMMRGICLTGGVFFLLTFSLLWYFERIAGIDPTELTVFFCIFVMLQWWNLFNARALGSHYSAFHRLWACRGFLLVLLLILTGQWLIVTFGGKMFRTVPLDATTWLYILLGTSPVLWLGEIYRKLKFKHS